MWQPLVLDVRSTVHDVPEMTPSGVVWRTRERLAGAFEVEVPGIGPMVIGLDPLREGAVPVDATPPVMMEIDTGAGASLTLRRAAGQVEILVDGQLAFGGESGEPGEAVHVYVGRMDSIAPVSVQWQVPD